MSPNKTNAAGPAIKRRAPRAYFAILQRRYLGVGFRPGWFSLFLPLLGAFRLHGKSRSDCPGVDHMAAWRKRMHPDDLQQFDRVLAQHIRKQGPFDVEYRIRGKGTVGLVRAAADGI